MKNLVVAGLAAAVKSSLGVTTAGMMEGRKGLRVILGTMTMSAQTDAEASLAQHPACVSLAHTQL